MRLPYQNHHIAKINPMLASAIVCLVMLLPACQPAPSTPFNILNNIPNNHSEPVRQSTQQVAIAALATPLVKPVDCTSLKPNQVVNVTGQWYLPTSCTLPANVSFVFSQANTGLNCNHNHLVSEDKKRSAFTIVSDKGINNIYIRNCRVTGYNHALIIKQKTPANVRYQRGDTNPDTLRQKAPHNIQINQFTSLNAHHSAVFVGDHVHHVNLTHLQIQGAGTTGVYLEFGSQHNRIANSVFMGNGFRRFKPNREAIAVDSSAYNVIENNQFIHNGAGGVFLYRNCFEHANDPSRSNHFLRTQGSHSNMITSNQFKEEDVGVWVASRQSRNLKGLACGAYVIQQNWLSSYHLDSAQNNQISRNQFVDTQQGIVVEDDGTLIEANQFAASVSQPIRVGSAIRLQTSNGAVKNTQIKHNIFKLTQPKTFTKLIDLHDGSAKLSQQCGNTLLANDNTLLKQQMSCL